MEDFVVIVSGQKAFQWAKPSRCDVLDVLEMVPIELDGRTSSQFLPDLGGMLLIDYSVD